MIPLNLENWNYHAIKEMISKGITESDKFEFKRGLTPKIAETSCAFANTSGGFIIFGILDQKEVNHTKKDRIQGLDYDPEFKRKFFEKIKDIQPTLIEWNVLEPPISIPKSEKIIYIVEISLSKMRPHMVNYKFLQRINGSNNPFPRDKVKEEFSKLAQRELEFKKTKVIFLGPPYPRGDKRDGWIQIQTQNVGEKATIFTAIETELSIEDLSETYKGTFSPWKRNEQMQPNQIIPLNTKYIIQKEKAIGIINNISQISAKIHYQLRYTDELEIKHIQKEIPIDEETLTRIINNAINNQ